MKDVKSEILRITRSGEKDLESGFGTLAIERTTIWLFKAVNGPRLPASA